MGVFREVVAMVQSNDRGRAPFFSEFLFNHSKGMVIIPEGVDAIGWRSFLNSLKLCFQIFLWCLAWFCAGNTV